MFKPEIHEKYDRRLNPAEFLSIYTIAVQAAGGREEKVFANYFLLALMSNVRSWLMHLLENSISSWADLCHKFIRAFTGGHQEPSRPSDLQLLQQKEGETLCKCLQRVSKVHRNIPNIHLAAIIPAFPSNVRNRRIRSKMNVRLPKTMKELYTLLDKCARMEEGRKLPGEEDFINVDSEDEDESTSQRKGKKHNKKPRDKAVITVEGSGTPSTGKKAKAEAPDKEVATCTTCREAAAIGNAGKGDGLYCKIHRTKGHDLQECYQVKQLVKKQRAEYDKRDKEKGQNATGGKG